MNLSLQKGDLVKTKEGLTGTIVKYASNTEIFLLEGIEVWQVSKEDIVEKIGEREVNKIHERLVVEFLFEVEVVGGDKVKIGDEVTFEETGPIFGVRTGILKYIRLPNLYIWGDGFRRMFRVSEVKEYNMKKVK